VVLASVGLFCYSDKTIFTDLKIVIGSKPGAGTLASPYPVASSEGVEMRLLSDRPFDFFTTRDGLAIRFGRWPAVGRGRRRAAVLILTGRTEFMEKYAETIHDLLNRGFDVLSFDWRGQGLSDRLLPDRMKGYVHRYEDYLEDLHYLVRHIFLPEYGAPPIVLAHSMGGHIALRFSHDHPELVTKAVLVSPMIEIFSSVIIKEMMRFFCRQAIKAGLREKTVWGSSGYGGWDRPFEGNRLSSDPVRFMDQKRAVMENPALGLGGVTYGWLAATLASIDILKRPGYAEKIQTPVLMVAAENDRVVRVKDQRRICSAMGGCAYICVPGARHEILKERDGIRSLFWSAFDTFATA